MQPYSLIYNVTEGAMVPSNENVTGGTMPHDERMTIDERRKYLKRMERRYQQADREGQARLLDEMEAVTDLHRKSLIRLLHTPEGLARHPRRQQRGRTYGPSVEHAVWVVSEALDHICAERLTPALPAMAEHLTQFGELELTPALRIQLATISESTVARLLARFAPERPRLPRKAVSPPDGLRRAIPMKRLPWDEQEPGHFETDLVHHSGEFTVGDYVHSLQWVDVATGWSERAAVLGRSQRAMEGGFRHILGRLPFPIRELHPDNGSEFFNHHMLRFFGDTLKGVDLSRSRPYQKNDNRFVEQKNRTLIRAFFGQARFDTRAHQALLDQLYDRMWLYYNLFQPVLRLVEKEPIPDTAELRYRRKWSEAQTPFERLVAKKGLARKTRRRLEELRAQTNPRQLRGEIYRMRDQLFDLPLATRPEDSALLGGSEGNIVKVERRRRPR
jgi:hypothetical protein